MTAVIVDVSNSPALRLPPGPPPGLPCHVAPAQPADRPALAALFAACSPETIRLRFFGQLRKWPGGYLNSALSAPPGEHDAVVAYGADRTDVLGLASLAAPCGPEPGVGELGVLIADAWQRQGLATTMLELLFHRARARGVERVAASVLHGRSALLTALARRLEPDGGLRTREGLTGVYRLTQRAR
ncbi:MULTISPECIES: GNAT family N-acetyltransferase [unclassified Streptomyces]|uniref:GNAT family N-acetyltransferase n=1 Tax=unclassified Streptomyces TaxID=2593676 RepID=UPI001F1FCB5F|nr:MULTISPECIES: GNAT family N-acetyltransferase [unclassified Streptomyces]